jgi:hypothetical protein
VQPIIAYSNKTFYKNQIRPLRVPKASERIDPPLVDVFIEQGVRGTRDVNKLEAEFIADEIEAILRDPRLRNRTLGVSANQPASLLRERSRARPSAAAGRRSAASTAAA